MASDENLTDTKTKRKICFPKKPQTAPSGDFEPVLIVEEIDFCLVSPRTAFPLQETGAYSAAISNLCLFSVNDYFFELVRIQWSKNRCLLDDGGSKPPSCIFWIPTRFIKRGGHYCLLIFLGSHFCGDCF